MNKVNKWTQSDTFLKLFPWPLICNLKVNVFVNPIEVSNLTWLGYSFDIKLEMKPFPKWVLCCLKIECVQKNWGVTFLVVLPKDGFVEMCAKELFNGLLNMK